jgi:hypothetical protein
MPKRTESVKSQLSTFISENAHDALRVYSDETGISIARLVDDAVRMLLKERTGKAVKK